MKGGRRRQEEVVGPRDAKKRFGQHFLEPAWVAKVIRAIDPQPDEVFVEIGPGRGALTRPLAARAKQVIAFEIDRDLAEALKVTGPPNLLVIPGDFLTLNFGLGHEGTDDPPPGAIRVAGNLPYNVASPILFKLIRMHSQWHSTRIRLLDATVMLQREVADRLVAQPGTSEYGVLSVLIRHSADVDRLLNLPAGAFRPAPKVQSSLVRLRFHSPDPAVRNPKVFEDLVQAVFTRRRKTLANALLAYDQRRNSQEKSRESLGGSGIDGQRRPETLSIVEFARLADALSK